MLFLGAGNIEGRKETKGKERRIISLNFFYLLCWGCRLNSVDSLWENYGFVVSMKEFDGFW